MTLTSTLTLRRSNSFSTFIHPTQFPFISLLKILKMSMRSKPLLPTPSQTFNQRKSKMLSALAVPDEEYTDLSPKGSIDVGIRDLIDEINTREGLVTTSSCAGRVSVYLEGRPSSQRQQESEENLKSSAAGGKGGGEWLFVSHDPISTLSVEKSYEALFGLLQQPLGGGEEVEEGEGSMIHFKFEPMILHILTASHGHAQRAIQAGMEAGFRETGAVSLLSRQDDDHNPIVAIRSMGLSFESLIGIEGSDGVRRAVVSSGYLKRVVAKSEKLFKENEKRISRFRGALKTAFEEKPKTKEGWEDAETRRERKRLEGLKRKEEMQKQKEAEAARIADAEPSAVEFILDPPEVL